MPQPSMATSLTNNLVTQVFECTNQPIRRAAASRGFHGDQFVLNVVQLRKPRACRSTFKVHSYRFENVATEFFPSLPLCEDGMAERTSPIATLLRIANLENQLHACRLLDECRSGSARYTPNLVCLAGRQ